MVAIASWYGADTGIISIISWDGTHEVRNTERTFRAAICQVDGRRHLFHQGRAQVVRDPGDVKRVEAAFATRYRPARENPRRVSIEIVVDRILGGT